MDVVRFIVITVPPRDVVERIEKFRAPAAEVSGSRVALAYPPHVTLRTGALVPAEEVPKFVDGFRSAIAGFEPPILRTEALEISTYTDGEEEKHFVGYLMEKTPGLMDLHARLLSYTPWIKSRQTSFHPHLSIAYGDLTAEGSVAVRRLMRENPDLAPASLEWICYNVGLYRQVEGLWKAFEVVQG